MIKPATSPRPGPKLVSSTDEPVEQIADSSPARLKSFVERIERLQEEIDGLNGDKKEVYAEAKGTGFDVKVMKIVIRLRKMESADRQEQEELVETYKRALGMVV